MLGFVKDKWVYIKCAKNGCMTYSEFLKRHGWQEINLFENDLNLNEMILWGHLTEPHCRHTRGVEQYVRNKAINVQEEKIEKLLVSGVFDEHTYSVSMMLGPLWYLPIHWIPLDTKITKWNQYPQLPEELNGDDLTNLFFQEQGIDLKITLEDRLNVSANFEIRNHVTKLKEEHYKNYQKLVKNFLEHDLMLYTKTVGDYNKKYSTKI
jgi:hypothetical protein